VFYEKGSFESFKNGNEESSSEETKAKGKKKDDEDDNGRNQLVKAKCDGDNDGNNDDENNQFTQHFKQDCKTLTIVRDLLGSSIQELMTLPSKKNEERSKNNVNEYLMDIDDANDIDDGDKKNKGNDDHYDDDDDETFEPMITMERLVQDIFQKTSAASASTTVTSSTTTATNAGDDDKQKEDNFDMKLDEIETIARKVSRSVVEDLSNILSRVAESRKTTVENRERQDPTASTDDIAISLICDEILPPDSVNNDKNSNDDDDDDDDDDGDAIITTVFILDKMSHKDGDTVSLYYHHHNYYHHESIETIDVTTDITTDATTTTTSTTTKNEVVGYSIPSTLIVVSLSLSCIEIGRKCVDNQIKSWYVANQITSC